MSALHGIRKLSAGVYELDVEWGDANLRDWYRFEVEDGVIVSRMPADFTHLHGWLLRPLTQAFTAYLRGEAVEFPVELGAP